MQVELNFIFFKTLSFIIIMAITFKQNLLSEYFDDIFAQFTYKIWKFAIKIICYPISIRTIPSNTVLILNLVQLGSSYSINTTDNTTAKFSTQIEQQPTIANDLQSTIDK